MAPEAGCEALNAGRRVVVIGGGLIGLEVAAASLARGCEVVVLEGAARVMARVVGPEISRYYETLHRDRGVTVMTGRMPVSIAADGAGCTVDAGRLTDTGAPLKSLLGTGG